MKTISRRIISVVVILSLLSGIFVINAFADENNLSHKTVAHHYFETLRSDIPANHHDSCGYVALGILLSFYDVYWNDAFVSSKFEDLNDAESKWYEDFPEVTPRLVLENNDLTVTQENNETAYRNFIQNNTDKYLHMYLLSLGISMSLHPANDDETGFGITIYETARILDEYFDNVFGDADYYREDQNYGTSLPVTIHIMREKTAEGGSVSVLNEIKAQVNKGNPVIYRANSIETASSSDGNSSGVGDTTNKVGHYMVAYNVTDTGNIEFHSGHITDPTDTFNDTDFNLDIDALWIEINEDVLPHVCTNDYEFYIQGEYIQVCSCVVYKYVHPEHTHLNVRFTSYTGTDHIYKCDWGCEITDTHNYTYTSTSNSLHTGICACGYSIAEEHNLERISPRYSVCTQCRYTRDHHLGGNENVHLGTKEEEETE